MQETPKTYIVDISDIEKTYAEFSKELRYEIRKCKQRVRVSDDLVKFDYFHSLSRPDRRIDYEFICNTYESKQPKCRLYATDTAMAMISWDDKKGYYLLAGRDKLMPPDGSPSLILWTAMQDLNKIGIKEFDMCGANKPNTRMFKKQFGGKLVEQKTPCLCY